MTTQYATSKPASDDAETWLPHGPLSVADADHLRGETQKSYLQAVITSEDKNSVVTEIGHLVAASTGPELLVYYSRDEANVLVPRVLASHEKSPAYDPQRAPLYPVAVDASTEGSPKTVSLAAPSTMAVVAVPVHFRGQAPEAIVAVYGVSEDSREASISALQLAAVHVTLWRVLQDGRRLDAEATSTAALHELLETMESSPNMAGAGHALVDKVQQYLDCTYVALGLCSGGSNRCRLLAISGVAGLDKQAPLTRCLEAALQESIVRDSLTIWPPPSAADRRGALAHLKLCSVANVDVVMTSPLREADGQVVGAWAFLGYQKTLGRPESQNFIRASETRVAACLSLLQRARRGLLGQLLGRARSKSQRWKRRVMLTLAGVACLCLLAPVPYKIPCDCRLEPVSRRFVAAPYDGILEKAFARPGDTVRQGDVLARMDGRELRMELAGVIAERDQASKQQNIAFAKHDFATADVAKLEVERLDLKKQILQRRQEKLDVKSPVDGIVTVGDLDKVEGAPVTRGQSLFEVAPLDKMIVELSVPEDEIEYTREGIEAVVRFESYPDRTWRETIAKLHPRAELRDNQNVFVAEFTLENTHGKLRPGMVGRAKVIGPDRAFAWVLLHKPWQWLRLRIGW